MYLIAKIETLSLFRLKKSKKISSTEIELIASGGSPVERTTGIEPAYSAWEADILPMNYVRKKLCYPYIISHYSVDVKYFLKKSLAARFANQ